MQINARHILVTEVHWSPSSPQSSLAAAEPRIVGTGTGHSGTGHSGTGLETGCKMSVALNDILRGM